MFKELSQGIYNYTSGPEYGKQDLGISPKGAMDRFSFYTGNILLGNREDSPALEIIFPPKLEIVEDGFIITTGAPYNGSKIVRGNKKLDLNHGIVAKVKKGDIIEYGQKAAGFRNYLCFKTTADLNGAKSPKGRTRGELKEYSTWPSEDGTIRVVKGPEYDALENPETFLENHWVISRDSGNMGIRLEAPMELKLNMGNMISEAVSDGTVQITANGPIVLLRHRQTVGGYPRCFNVIQADVDRLAQYMPGEVVRFSLIDIEDALKVSEKMRNDLNRLRQRLVVNSKIYCSPRQPRS